ncbi:MAG: D-alanyl-D-alanine carboxypeptidase [Clostridia bacterium]|nr:D-alanyl-D-alanine carboxypeptidase [Clostridia bacterium]
MKKFICVAVCAALIICCSPLALAQEAVVCTEYYYEGYLDPLESIEPVSADVHTTLDISAKSVILMEPYTKKILYESNCDEKLAPASITKIMSLLLIMEAIDEGKLTLETQVTTSEHAASMGGSQIWLEPGETMSVHELLKATVIASANDATTALAEAVAGSEEGFVALMNERAGELGMSNTHFENCSGLDAENHLTTAHDVAIMSSELIKHSLIKEYSTVWMDSLRDGKSELVNTNKLVRFYEGTTGLKTGTTSTAGHCLAATAERDGLELVAVVMGAPTTNDRFNGARKLLDFGFANWSFATIEPDLTEISVPKVEKGTGLPLVLTAQPLNLLLKKGATDKIERTPELPETITAPVTKGQVVGYLHLTLDGEQVGVIELKAASDIPKMNFFVAIKWLIAQLMRL